MMKKRTAGVALALLAIGTLLVGCGKKSEEMVATNLASFEIENYVTLADYSAFTEGIEPMTAVTDADVDSYISGMLQDLDAEEKKILTGTVAAGDVVNIDYVGTIDGVAFDGGTADDQFLEIGSGMFIPGFEDGLIGVEVGETEELFLTFPEEYHSADLAGKDCVFAVTVNYILGPLTDDIVVALDEGYSTVDEYKAYIKSALQDYMESQYIYNTEGQMSSNIVANCTFGELPDSLVQDYREDLVTTFTSYASNYGMTLEDYVVAAMGVEASEVETALDKIALQCAQEGVAIQAIANKEKLNVSDEDLETELTNIAISNGYADGNAYLEAVGVEKELVRVSLMSDRVYEYLMANGGLLEK